MLSMKIALKPVICFLALVACYAANANTLDTSFDAAPFALPLPDGNGLLWEDPREIHRVIVHFGTNAPVPETVHLEYWGSRWPEQHLPKDRQPGGADVGWMELGNWHTGGWRVADAETKTSDSDIIFTFHPISAKEFSTVKTNTATFRYTLKIRVTSSASLPRIERLETFTYSLS